MKKNAISLIVLVITILVMAILAATVIITLSNTNIINKANDVIEKNNKASEKEAINVAVAASYLEVKGKITTATLQKSMDEQFGSGSVEVEDAGSGAYTITMKGTSNNVYTIESDKTITDGKYDKWDGSSVEEPTIEGTNMKIAKASQLKWLSNQVNA